MPIPLDAIRALVAYNWSDEQHDYEMCVPGMGDATQNGRDGHIFHELQRIQEWLNTNPPAVVRQLVVRDPDYENDYTTEGEIETYEFDLGASFNGRKDFDPEDAENQMYVLSHLGEAAALPEDSTVRAAIIETAEGLLGEDYSRANLLAALLNGPDYHTNSEGEVEGLVRDLCLHAEHVGSDLIALGVRERRSYDYKEHCWRTHHEHVTLTLADGEWSVHTEERL